MIRLLILVGVIFPVTTFADGGSVVGNSGHGVYCPAEVSSKRLRLLDFYELELFDRIEAKLGDPNDSPEMKARSVIDWIAQYDPDRSKEYGAALSTFFARTTWSQAKLPFVPDSHPTVLPAGCKEVQLAIQERSNGGVHYEIDQNLWNQLSPTQRAGLLLHEILYSDAISLGHDDSTNTRGMVRYLVKENDTGGGGPYFHWRYVNAIDQFYFDHAGVYSLANGDRLYLLRTDYGLDYKESDGRPYFTPAHWGIQTTVCGYHTVAGEEVKHCSPLPGKRKTYVAVVGAEGDRIYKIYPIDGPDKFYNPPLYLAPPREFGLPFDALDFDAPVWMRLKAQYIIDTSLIHATCRAGSEVVFSEAPSDLKNRFDMSRQALAGCTLDSDSGNPASLLLQGSWRQVRPGTAFQFEIGPENLFKAFVAFAHAEAIHIGAVSIIGTKLIHWPDEGTFAGILAQTVSLPEGSCQLAANDDESVGWSRGSLDINEKVSCSMNIDGQGLPLNAVSVDLASAQFQHGTLAKKTKLKIILVDSESGAVKFKGVRELSAGIEIYRSKEAGYVEVRE